MLPSAQPWLYALKVYAHPRVVGMLFLGFSTVLALIPTRLRGQPEFR